MGGFRHGPGLRGKGQKRQARTADPPEQQQREADKERPQGREGTKPKTLLSL